jgi:hypothetical protein
VTTVPDLAQTRTALLIYGGHLPICGTRTAAGCDCGWAEWQRHLELGPLAHDERQADGN